MKYRQAVILLALSMLGFSSFVIASQPELDALEMQTAKDMYSVILSVEAYKIDNNAVPGPTDGVVTTEFLLPYLQPVYIRELPIDDGWGKPFGYWSDGKHYIVVSYGADGLADRDYAGVREFEDGGDDFVTLDGTEAAVPLHMQHMVQSGKQKRTMADMRSIATSVEAYRTDNGAVPGPTPGEVQAAWLVESVQPVYIRELPLADGWGRPFVYWSDGQHYRIVSLGADGVQDRPYEEIVRGTGTQLFTADIVFEDGEFVQFPEGEQR